MYRVPKNVQCDPRITCAVSIDGKGCKGQHKMADITNDWKPEQICGEVSKCGKLMPLVYRYKIQNRQSQNNHFMVTSI